MKRIFLGLTLTFMLVLFALHHARLGTSLRPNGQQAARMTDEPILAAATSAPTALPAQLEQASGQSTAQTTTAIAQGRSLDKANASQALLGIDLVLDLSNKIFLSEDDRLKLQSALLDEGTLSQIRKGLFDPSLLKADRFKERLRHMDALYEGLKFKDSQVQTVYSAMAQDFLISRPPQAARGNRALQEQFFGDRVELVLTLSAIDPELSKSIESNAVALDQKTEIYFARAHAMAGTYRMSL